MIQYKDFQPTQYDTKGLGLSERQDWLVLDCGRNRDSSTLEESNFAIALEKLGGESESVEVHRFGHWGPGWFEIILIDPNSDSAKVAKEIESKLEECGYLSEDDYYERLHKEADEVWKECYTSHERIEFIRKHMNDFDFYSFSDLLACCRGKFFSGDAVGLVG